MCLYNFFTPGFLTAMDDCVDNVEELPDQSFTVRDGKEVITNAELLVQAEANRKITSQLYACKYDHSP